MQTVRRTRTFTRLASAGAHGAPGRWAPWPVLGRRWGGGADRGEPELPHAARGPSGTRPLARSALLTPGRSRPCPAPHLRARGALSASRLVAALSSFCLFLIWKPRVPNRGHLSLSIVFAMAPWASSPTHGFFLPPLGRFVRHCDRDAMFPGLRLPPGKGPCAGFQCLPTVFSGTFLQGTQERLKVRRSEPMLPTLKHETGDFDHVRSPLSAGNKETQLVFFSSLW